MSLQLLVRTDLFFLLMLVVLEIRIVLSFLVGEERRGDVRTPENFRFVVGHLF